jgi:hypothetical protein
VSPKILQINFKRFLLEIVTRAKRVEQGCQRSGGALIPLASWTAAPPVPRVAAVFFFPPHHQKFIDPLVMSFGAGYRVPLAFFIPHGPLLYRCC